MNICNVICGPIRSRENHKCQCNKVLFGIYYLCFSGTILQITCNIQSRFTNLGQINAKEGYSCWHINLTYSGPLLYNYNYLTKSLANFCTFLGK